ncbi:MAG: type II secretion system protein [Minisyncoccota bacterium]
MYIRSSKKGFTFIELAVSVSIIGILSAIILSGVASTRKSARVAQRIADIKQVQSALDLYYANNRAYPSTGGVSNWRSTCSAWGGYTRDNVIPGLVPEYIKTIPADPQTVSSSVYNCYLYTSNGTDYAFLVHDVTELKTGSGATYAKYPELYDPIRPTWAWKISSPGGVSY